MTHQFEHTRADPLPDEPHPRLAPSPQVRNASGKPGTQVVAICLAIDLILAVLAPRIRTFFSSELTRSIALGAVYGTLAAQFAMAAFWLGVMATALYWMLAGVVLFCIAVLALLPTQVPWPSLLFVAWCGLTFTLPFALVRLAGHRIEERHITNERDSESEPIQFPLSRLFGWTFAIAALLGIARLVPAAVALSLATSLGFFAVAVIGLATLWAMLWPGRMRRPLSLAPFAALAVVVFFGHRANGWRVAETIGVVAAGLLYILTLAGLLARYRAAGRRLVACSGRGWLVR